MKTIELNTSIVDNGGARRDAGDRIAVGDKAGQVAADRAKAMVDAGEAVSVREAKPAAPKKAAAKKPPAKGKGTVKAPAKPVPPAPAPTDAADAGTASSGQ